MTSTETSAIAPGKKWTWSPDRALWLLALAGLLVGGYGLYLHFTNGQRLTALTSFVPWGLGVATYVYLVWLEVGSVLVFTLLVYVFRWNTLLPGMARMLYLTALVILVMALILIGLDLGHPFRAWHALVYPQWGSLMTWMIWLHVAYLALLLAKLLLEVRGRSPLADRVGLWLSVLGLPLGVAVVVVVGSLFGVMLARPLWQGSTLPLYFLLSSLVAGSGLVTFLFVWFWPGVRDLEYRATAQRLGRLLLSALIIGLISAALGGIVILYPGVPAQATALQLTLFGPFWWVFWVLHIGAGVIVPIVLLVTRSRAARRIGVASGLLVLTFIAVPLNIVIPPQVAVGMLDPGLVNAFAGPGLAAEYFPTAAEWLLTLFALAFGLLVFLYGYHVLWLRPRAQDPVAPGGSAAPEKEE